MSNAETKAQMSDGKYSIKLTKILRDGKRTKDSTRVIKMSKKEYNVFKKHTDQNGLGSTGFDEYEVVHDPTKVIKEEIKEEVKPAAKPKGRPPIKKE